MSPPRKVIRWMLLFPSKITAKHLPITGKESFCPFPSLLKLSQLFRLRHIPRDSSAVRTRMLGLPDGFPDENGERHMSNQAPLSFHPRPESGSGNVPEDGGFFYPAEQSFNSACDYGLNFSFLPSGAQPFEMGHQFMHPGTSGIYVNHSAGIRVASSSELLSLPSGVTPGHAFPSHYSSIYEPNLTADTPHYSSGFPQLQDVNNALSAHSRNSIVHAPSPCGSDSSFDEVGSGYSSPSNMTPHRNSTTTLPPHSETEAYLRNTLDIPPHLLVDLSALPDASERKHPPITHMIKLAIWGSKDKMLTLRGIYNEIEERYPPLKGLQDKPWQRSIRHNLSLKAIFVRVERPPSVPGSGHYWAIDIRNGEGNKRDRKRKDPSSRGSSSRSRSDEEDDFSEDVDEERSRHGEQGAIRIPSQIPIQYERYTANPSMFASASVQTESRMSHPSAMPPPRIGQPFPHPQSAQTATPSDLYAYPRGMPLSSSIEHRPVYIPTYTFTEMPNQNPFIQEQMPMANMAPSMTGHQMPMLGPYPYGRASGSRRPTPDEDQDDNRKSKRRNID